ncbi:MAG: nucleotide exchange factor GrpE [Solirubrobacteraceae bacterium]|jgi:molecular chaperone GrpE
MTEQDAGIEGAALGAAETQNGEPPVPAVEDAVDLAKDARAETELELDVEQLSAKAAQRDEFFGLAQRTQADFENYRKRMARELEGAQARGIARLATELVPALDNLERAITGACAAAVVDEQLIEGLRLVQRELLAALGRAGIEPYGEAGEAFDPALHEAVGHQPVEGASPGSVVEVYQPGYKLGGAVIRAARVMVAA